MRSGLSRSLLLGLAMWSSHSFGCKDSPGKPSREECTKVAENIAALISANFEANPDYWWESIHNESSLKTGLPKEVTQEGFKAWLATPAGQTWTMLRRGQTSAGVQQGIATCVENATRPQVKCLLAAKTKADVLACDEKFAKKQGLPARAPAPAGSASGSGTGSAM